MSNIPVRPLSPVTDNLSVAHDVVKGDVVETDRLSYNVPVTNCPGDSAMSASEQKDPENDAPPSRTPVRPRTPQPENLQLARNVKVLMETKGWTPSELARQAGISKQVVSTLNLGYTRPTRHNLLAIARALGVPVTQLDPEYEDIVANSVDTTPTLSATQAPDKPGYAVLIVNRIVRWRTAIEVQKLLAEDGPDDERKTSLGR
ncbi:MAG: helix-turn-helix transcriptional regulator [Methylorubrum rhodinum]|uniref:helix-turn-helix domain-containing protein n=1 Tax=Methylorubrum rhodinum TaxID=29428 RepID=UPI003BB00AE4